MISPNEVIQANHFSFSALAGEALNDGDAVFVADGEFNRVGAEQLDTTGEMDSTIGSAGSWYAQSFVVPDDWPTHLESVVLFGDIVQGQTRNVYIRNTPNGSDIATASRTSGATGGGILGWNFDINLAVTPGETLYLVTPDGKFRVNENVDNYSGGNVLTSTSSTGTYTALPNSDMAFQASFRGGEAGKVYKLFNRKRVGNTLNLGVADDSELQQPSLDGFASAAAILGASVRVNPMPVYTNTGFALSNGLLYPDSSTDGLVSTTQTYDANPIGRAVSSSTLLRAYT